MWKHVESWENNLSLVLTFMPIDKYISVHKIKSLTVDRAFEARGNCTNALYEIELYKYYHHSDLFNLFSRLATAVKIQTDVISARKNTATRQLWTDIFSRCTNMMIATWKCVISVISHFKQNLNLKDILSPTRQRDPASVSCVGSHTGIKLPYLFTWRATKMRNHSNASFAMPHSSTSHQLSGTVGHTLRKNHSSAASAQRDVEPRDYCHHTCLFTAKIRDSSAKVVGCHIHLEVDIALIWTSI